MRSLDLPPQLGPKHHTGTAFHGKSGWSSLLPSQPQGHWPGPAGGVWTGRVSAAQLAAGCFVPFCTKKERGRKGNRDLGTAPRDVLQGYLSHEAGRRVGTIAACCPRGVAAGLSTFSQSTRFLYIHETDLKWPAHNTCSLNSLYQVHLL